MLTVIYISADLYVKEDADKFHMKQGDTYCITLQELVDHQYLKTPLEDVTTGEEIELNRTVKYYIGENKEITHSLVKPKNCKQQNQKRSEEENSSVPEKETGQIC